MFTPISRVYGAPLAGGLTLSSVTRVRDVLSNESAKQKLRIVVCSTRNTCVMSARSTF